MLSLLLKYLPQIAIGVALIGFGIYLGHQFSKPALNRVRAEYEAFQLQTAHEKQAMAQAAQAAVQAQIDARIKQESTNAQALQELQAQADHVAADRDLSQRLLAAARKAGSGGGPVPETADQPRTADPAEASGDRPLAADLAAAIGECRDAFDTLTALQTEIRSQL